MTPDISKYLTQQVMTASPANARIHGVDESGVEIETGAEPNQACAPLASASETPSVRMSCA